MISIQVVAQMGLTDASSRPAAVDLRFHDFRTVPRVGEIITVWHDDEPQKLRVIAVEHCAAHEEPDTEMLSGGLVAPGTRVIAQWLNE